jgi:hypothetical protein
MVSELVYQLGHQVLLLLLLLLLLELELLVLPTGQVWRLQQLWHGWTLWALVVPVLLVQQLLLIPLLQVVQ